MEWLHDIMNTHDALRDLLLNLKFSLRRWAKDATSQVLTRTDSFWLPVRKRALFNRRVKHMLMEGLPRDDFRFPTCRRDLNSDLDESGKSKTRTVTELSYDDLHAQLDDDSEKSGTKDEFYPNYSVTDESDETHESRDLVPQIVWTHWDEYPSTPRLQAFINSWAPLK